MKKLLLLALLLCSFSMSAQQFINYYYWGLSTEEGVKGKWFPTDVKVYYNYNNDTKKIKFDVNGTIFELTQVGGTTKQKTTTGLEYQHLEMTDDKTGESASVNLFDDTRYGVMLIFEGYQNSLQFAP